MLDALLIAAVSGIAGAPAHDGAALVPTETLTNTPTKATRRYNMMSNEGGAGQ
jgi:hypothetical protein